MRRFLAQRLRHRIDIERLTVDINTSGSDGNNGAQDEDFSPILEGVAAEIVALRGDELVAAAAINGEISNRITIHVQDIEIRPSDRVRHGSITYDLRAVLPDLTEARFLQLMVTSGVNDG